MKTTFSTLLGLSLLLSLNSYHAYARPCEEIQNDIVSACRQAQIDLKKESDAFLDSKVPDELKTLHQKLKENDAEIRKKIDAFLLENPEEKTAPKEMLDQYGASSRALRETEERITRIRYRAKETEYPQELLAKQQALEKLQRELYNYYEGFSANRIRFVKKDEKLPQKVSDLINEYQETQEKEIKDNKEKAEKFFDEQFKRIRTILLAAKQPTDLDDLILELNSESGSEQWRTYSYSDPQKDYGGSRRATSQFVCQFQDYLACKSQNDAAGAIQILDTLLRQEKNEILLRSDILELKNPNKINHPQPELTKLTGNELVEKIKLGIQDAESYESLMNLDILCKEALRRKSTSEYHSLSQYEMPGQLFSIIRELWEKAIDGERIQLDFSIPRNNYSNYDKSSAFLGLKWRDPFLLAACAGYLGKKPEASKNFSQFIHQEISTSISAKDWDRLALVEAFFAAMGKNIDTFFMFSRPPGFSEMMVGYRLEKAGLVENAVTAYRKALEIEGSQELLSLIADRLNKIKKEYPTEFNAAKK